MNPIEFKVEKTIKNSPKAVCENILDVETWSSFDGHGLIPGIEKAFYEKRTGELVGSIIRVKNSDGTEHLEEIIEWEKNRKLVMKIYNFPTALSYMATHFIEDWDFKQLSENETLLIRKLKLYPVSFLTKPLLGQISGLMEKAMKKQLGEMAENLSL